jgi:hypothetical protein
MSISTRAFFSSCIQYATRFKQSSIPGIVGFYGRNLGRIVPSKAKIASEATATGTFVPQFHQFGGEMS